MFGCAGALQKYIFASNAFGAKMYFCVYFVLQNVQHQKNNLVSQTKKQKSKGGAEHYMNVFLLLYLYKIECFLMLYLYRIAVLCRWKGKKIFFFF